MFWRIRLEYNDDENETLRRKHNSKRRKDY
jgi:hypothetical protein